MREKPGNSQIILIRVLAMTPVIYLLAMYGVVIFENARDQIFVVKGQLKQLFHFSSVLCLPLVHSEVFLSHIWTELT